MYVYGLFIFFKDFIYLLLEAGERREKESKRNTDMRIINPLPLIGTLTTHMP